jgi:two-component system, NtrC family, nitrogen regulation response regulator GlnG
MQTVLAIDPDPDFLTWVTKHLTAPDVQVITAPTADVGFQLVQKQAPDLVVADLHLSPVNGMELLKRIRQNDPNSVVILHADFPPSHSVIEAMKLGAYEFLRKGSLIHELRPVVEEALASRESILATAAVTPLDTLQQQIIGQSPPMQSVFKLIGRASRSVAPVMVTGESGCGKEVVARAIHKFSSRVHKEFVAINCAAIPEQLLESELFGHEKGSFTGAVAQRIGRFEQCDGGTLFLDEIGDMPHQVQSKLLRVLQEGEFSRVGSNQTLKTDVRILAATNRNLEKDVESNRFREDLFYRLNVIRIHLPPVRERREDIRPLAQFFLQKIAKENRLPTYRLSEEAMRHLERWPWPGNVRELENTLRGAIVLATSDVLLPKDIPLAMTQGTPAPEASAPSDKAPSAAPTNEGLLAAAVRLLVQEAVTQTGTTGLIEMVENELTRQAWLHTGQDAAQTAKLLGLSSAALTKKLKGLTES